MARETEVKVVYDRCLPAGKRNTGEIPVINCLRWHPKPNRFCVGNSSVLACATSCGFLVYSCITVGDDVWHTVCHRKPQKGREGLCVEWNPEDLKMLVTGTGCSDMNDGGLVRILQYEGGRLRTKRIFGPARHGGAVHSMAFSSDGTILVASVFGLSGSEPHASLWIINLGVSRSARMTEKLIEYPERCSSAVIVKFLPSLHVLVTSCNPSRKLLTWRKNKDQWDLTSTFNVDSPVLGMSFSTAGAHLLTLSSDGKLNLWKTDMSQNPWLTLIATEETVHRSPSLITWAGSQFFALAYSELGISIYEVQNLNSRSRPTMKYRVLHTGILKKITYLCMNQPFPALACGGSDGLIHILSIWDTFFPKPHPEYPRFFAYEDSYYKKPLDPSVLDPEMNPEVKSWGVFDVVSHSSEGSDRSLEEYFAQLSQAEAGVSGAAGGEDTAGGVDHGSVTGGEDTVGVGGAIQAITLPSTSSQDPAGAREVAAGEDAAVADAGHTAAEEDAAWRAVGKEIKGESERMIRRLLQGHVPTRELIASYQKISRLLSGMDGEGPSS